jgi:hypothetical protein
MRMTTLGAAIAIVGLATSSAFAEGTPGTSPSPSAGAQNAAYCLEKSSGQKTCTYATMASCESAKSGTDKCTPNPAATSGSGTGRSTPMSPPSSSSPSR